MTSRQPRTFLRDSVILFLGVLAASYLVGPIEAESTTTLIFVALILALLNSVIKPILILFTLPFVIFTFGLGLLIINAFLLYTAGALVPGFSVPGFGPAFLGALIISLLNLTVNVLLTPRPKISVKWDARSKSEKGQRIRGDDIIDV